jgi:PadR family transcriptional regulator, regulatory protein PadR
MRITLETIKVLKVFLQKPDEPQYGLAITKASGIQAGTLYPILIRLERNGWLQSEFEDIDPKREGRSARRYYTLTDQGRRDALKTLDEASLPLSNQGVRYA